MQRTFRNRYALKTGSGTGDVLRQTVPGMNDGNRKYLITDDGKMCVG